MLLLSASPVVTFGTSATAGAALVQDLVPGSNSSYPQNLTAAGDKLFFVAYDQNLTYDKLWVTDGSTATIPAPAASLEANAPIAAGSSVVFDAYDSKTNQFEVWVSDGTAAGTTSIAVLPRSTFNGGVTVGSTAYFEIYDNPANRYEIWKSDGTSAGTGLVSAIPENANSLTASGNRLYFTTVDTVSGSRLWSSDGTGAGTGVVATLDPTASYSPQQLTDVNGTLYFIASSSDGTGTPELWRSDGTPAGTATISTPLPPKELAADGTKLVFTGMDAFDTAGVWITDGTAAGTTQLQSLPAGSPFGLAVANHTIFFGEYPDALSTFQLWSSNGTPAGTQTIASLVDSTEFTAAGSRIYFAVDDPVAGNELYASDGTPAGTALVADINPGAPSSNPSGLTALGSTLFFSADDGSHGTELWKVNPPVQAFLTTVNEGSVFAGVGSFNDAAANGPWSATIDYGDGSGVQPLTLNADDSFQLNHLYADDGAYSLTVSVTNSAGSTGVGGFTVTVNNVAPTASIVGSPASSPEGTSIPLSASATDPSSVDTAGGFTDAWSVTKNGASFSTGSGAGFSFTPDDNGVYVVTLTATDEDGLSGTASQTILATNVPPTPTILGAPATSPEATAIALTSSVTDPSPVDTAAGFKETWGVTKNGVSFATGTGPSFSFTPDDNGTYVVMLAATDKDGGSGSVCQTIIVTNVAPTPTIVGTPATGSEGTAIGLTASVTDPSPVDTAAGFTDAWSVLKNGVSFASGTGSSFSFTPNDDGTYVVTLAATDKDGGTGSVSQTITVADAGPTAQIVGAPSSAAAGTAINLTASVTDPSSVDTAAGFQQTWTVTSNGATVGTGSGSSYQFTPTLGGTYVVTLKATDKDGASSTASQSITVTAPSQKLTVSGDSDGVPGEPRSLKVAVSTGQATGTTATSPVVINWGDGSPVQTIAPGKPLSVLHAFSKVGTYSVKVSSTAADGSTSTATWSIQIASAELQTDPFFPTLKDLVIGASSSSDQIRLCPGSTKGTVQVSVNKTVIGTFSPTGLVVVFASSTGVNVQVASGVKLPVIELVWANPANQASAQHGGGCSDFDCDDILEALVWNRS